MEEEQIKQLAYDVVLHSVLTSSQEWKEVSVLALNDARRFIQRYNNIVEAFTRATQKEQD